MFVEEYEIFLAWVELLGFGNRPFHKFSSHRPIGSDRWCPSGKAA
jgi:hypothetical protein